MKMESQMQTKEAFLGTFVSALITTNVRVMKMLAKKTA
jgi:hypothetical protein